MAKTAVTKSSVIRAIIEKKPAATVSEIQAVLKEQGVKASVALVNKIKYAKPAKKGRKRRSSVSKAESIRLVWRELGVQTRPRDVVAQLASQGVKVSSAQVSMLRGTNGHATKSAGQPVSFDNLVAAKSLVDKLGSINAAQDALSSLAKLLQA